MSKYNIGLKILLQEGLSESEFYGNLVFKFRKIVGKTDFIYNLKRLSLIRSQHDYSAANRMHDCLPNYGW